MGKTPLSSPNPSEEFNAKNYLQTNGTAMGTKMAVAIANIFLSAVETEITNLSKT